MIKINFRSILTIVTIVMLGMGIFIIYMLDRDNNQVFSGSKTSNDNQFLLDFDILNSTISSTMLLSEGEMIETSINIKKGDVDIFVENENGISAYRGNDVETSKFIIGIKETGTYTFSVKGSKAEGSVYFIKLHSKP